MPISAIEAFCGRWQVEELALFGSALRDDFGPDSHILTFSSASRRAGRRG